MRDKITSMNGQHLKQWIVLFSIGALALCSASAQDDSDTEPNDIGSRIARAAPAFKLKNLDGAEVKLSDFDGKAMIVVFWATWDEWCRKQIPTLIELQQQYGTEGFTVLGISVDDKGTTVVKEFAAEHKINFPIVMTDLKVIHEFGGLTHVPTSFVIDKNHNIIQKRIGRVAKEVYEADLKAILRK